MWWHRDLAPAHTSRASATGGNHATHALVRTARRRARIPGPAAGVGPPSPRARGAHVPRHPRPLRPRPGRGPRGCGPARGDHRRGGRYGDGERPGTRRHRGHRPGDHAADGAGGDATRRAVATHPQRRAADAAGPRPGHLAAPRPEGEVGARGGDAARVPEHARRGELHRDPDAQVRRLCDRVRRERLPGRLLRPAGVPRAEPAVLQAADGGRLRAGLRGRAGVPGRAARHRAPPRRVRLPRRRARVHPRPPRRAGRAARRAGRHGLRHPRVRRVRGRARPAPTCPWCPKRSR